MKTVCVLLSVYNGEKYLDQQINSILNQEKVKVVLIARNDGSTDTSIKILNKYCDSITILDDVNIGIQNSFSQLLAYGLNIECDYYAFADQDDFWKSEKLHVATELLDKTNQGKPAVYFSNLKYTDVRLNSAGYVFNDKLSISRRNSLVRNYAYGCTQVFNKRAAEIYCKGIGKRMWMHDYWLYLIAVFMGDYIYDDVPHILYRQHGCNNVGYHISLKKKIKNKFKSLALLKESPRIDMATDFKECYWMNLNEDSIEILNEFILCRYSLVKRVQALLTDEYFNLGALDNFILRIRFILGAV